MISVLIFHKLKTNYRVYNGGGVVGTIAKRRGHWQFHSMPSSLSITDLRSVAQFMRELK